MVFLCSILTNYGIVVDLEDMTFIGRGYTVFLFDESLYSSKKLGEFSTQEAAIDHATG